MMAETSAVERENYTKVVMDFINYTNYTNNTNHTNYTNYTKVVMQKTLCVPLLTDWEQR